MYRFFVANTLQEDMLREELGQPCAIVPKEIETQIAELSNLCTQTDSEIEELKRTIVELSLK